MQAVGIDLGGTGIKAGRVTSAGEIEARRGAPTRPDEGAAAVLDRMAALAGDLLAGSGARAVGIGVPGLLDPRTGIVRASPNLASLVGVAVRAEIARRLGLDVACVAIENDANAAAVGEHWLGAARGRDDVLCLTLGTGVGGGLILGGALQRGARGMAGEIGHVVVDPRGPACGCGARGCLETLASASAARRRAIEVGLPHEAPGDLEQLVARARERAGPERELVHAVGRDLGRGLAVAVTLLDLACFVVGGGFGAALDALEPGVREGIAERSYGERAAAVELLPAALGPDAGWIGAARGALPA